MINISIKRKLLIYNIIIQIFVLFLFSFSLYKTLEISSKDKLEATLKVILLDVVDDIIEHKNEMDTRDFDEEKEYKFEPLYIRLLKVENQYEIIKSTLFANDIKIDTDTLKKLELNQINFEYQKNYIISKLKIQIDKKNYVVEVATDFSAINSTLENLIYILIFIVPIILILSIIGGYFLIYKSFLPIERLLQNLKNINASDLSKRLEFKNRHDEIDLLSQEINNLLQRLEISFDKISQFSSDASHELKTPLTIIRGEIEVALRKKRSSKDYEQTLNSCLDEVLLIQETIDDLLFLAKNENDFAESFLPCYSDEITLEAIKEMKSFAYLKHIDIHVQIEKSVVLNAYSTLLKVALKNIIKNAITFSHENQKVIIKTFCNDDAFSISVQDFGIGIAKNEQEKIFEKFYRTDKSRNKESGGSGLGMAIAEKIIQLHQGKIYLESKESQGTKIIFEFKKFERLEYEH